MTFPFLKMGMKKAPLKVYFQKCLFLALPFFFVILTFPGIMLHFRGLALRVRENFATAFLPAIFFTTRYFLIAHPEIVLIPENAIPALIGNQPCTVHRLFKVW